MYNVGMSSMLQSAAEHKRTIFQILACAGMNGLHSVKWFCFILLVLTSFVFGCAVLLVILDNPNIVFVLGAMLIAAVAVLEPHGMETHIPFKYQILAWIGTGSLLGALFWVLLAGPPLKTVGFQSSARLENNASDLRFASDSKSFFTYSWKVLYHYDLSGNILGQIQFEEYIEDFCVSANGEEVGVLVNQPIFGNDKCTDNLVDFIVVNVQDMTVARRIRLLSGDTRNQGRKVLFSPTTNTWIVHCHVGTENHLFALESNSLKKQAETMIDIPNWSPDSVSIYFVPGLDGTVAIDFLNKSQLWNYLSNELINQPTRMKYPLTIGQRFFSGPFPRTVAAFDFHHENKRFTVFPFDSDTPSYDSTPFPLEMRQNEGGWRIVSISDDFKTALFFYHRPVMLQLPSPQRVFVLDVPSMKIIAEKTSRSPFIREVFLSPDGKYVAMFVHLNRNRREKTTYAIDIYEVSDVELRPSEQWREVKTNTFFEQ